MGVSESKLERKSSVSAFHRISPTRRKKSLSPSKSQSLQKKKKVGKFRQLIGRKCDIYDVVCKKWSPSSIIDANDEEIKINYDGYASKWDEWINVINDGDRIASLHTHTKDRSREEMIAQQFQELQRLTKQLQLKSIKEKKAEKLKQFIGTRCDVYDLTIKQWWPCTVIESNDTDIKVRYDGYSAKYDEWIDPNSERKDVIHKHTKNHQTHKESEWNQATDFSFLPDTLISSTTCPYYSACSQLIKAYTNDSKMNIAMFEPNGHRCFCSNCHEMRGDGEVYSRGKPSQSYVLPIGYARFGIKLSSEQSNVLSDWHVVYHGTKSVFLPEVSESGLILLKPNDFKLNGSKHQKNKTRLGHIQQKFIRTNKHTKQKETFDPNQIFTSPSCIYSSYYCDKTMFNDHKVSFMFQCRQKPGTYSRGQETMAFGDEKIDKWISNDSIEFYTKHNLYIIITGILIKIHDFGNDCTKEEEKSEETDDEVECGKCDGSGRYKIGICFKCQGLGRCKSCSGSGVYKRALMCNRCNGSGTFRNGKDCRKCNGSGVYKPAIRCKFCKGTARCKKCDSTGKFTVPCRKCHGSGMLHSIR